MAYSSEEILPHDSPIKKPNAIVTNLVWSEYYPVTIFINSPLDITNKGRIDRLNEMLDRFEAMPKCKGALN